jgi:5-methylthioadenosine/S-adenosylhomocysteine deaminase
MDILREKGVIVASNPVSNLKLASGICPVSAMMEKGITVALGTDSVSSNNNLNFLEEIKTFAMLAKVREMNPTLITPKEALTAATRNGAMAQGRTDCGILAEGNKADLIVLRTDVPNMRPVHSLLSNLVYSASSGDIVLTMVDGKVLYENGEYTTIDVEKTIYETEKATAHILEQL